MSYEFSAQSLAEFIGILDGLDKKVNDEFYSECEFLYRGQSNSYFDLIPAIGRFKGGDEDINFVERNLISEAISKYPNTFNVNLKPIELLSMLQHYGIPTRLLDLSENAFVALYFACCSNQDDDGEVFIFENQTYDIADYPITEAIADSYRFSVGSFYPLEFFYNNVIEQPYFLEQKIRVKYSHKTPQEKANWVRDCCKKPLFIKGNQKLERQRIQRGRYILFPNMIETVGDGNDPVFVPKIEPLKKDDDSIIAKIIIPAKNKKNILEGLSCYAGINRAFLFGDSIDIVCEEITKKYFN